MILPVHYIRLFHIFLFTSNFNNFTDQLQESKSLYLRPTFRGGGFVFFLPHI